MVASATYSYLPAFTYFGNQVKIVHFIGRFSPIPVLILANNVLTGATKPWLISFDEAGKARIGDCEKHCHNHLQLWWQIFNNLVRPALNKSAELSRDKTVLSCLNTVTSSGYMETPPSPTSLPPADNR